MKNIGNFKSASDHNTTELRANGRRNETTAPRESQKKKKIGNNKRGMIFIWQLSARNSPQSAGFSRKSMTDAMKRNITMTGSVFP